MINYVFIRVLEKVIGDIVFLIWVSWFYNVNMEEFCSMVRENNVIKFEILLRLLFKIISCRDSIWMEKFMLICF